MTLLLLGGPRVNTSELWPRAQLFPEGVVISSPLGSDHLPFRDRKTEAELLILRPILIPHLEPGGCPLNSFCSEPSSCSSVTAAQYLGLTFIQSLS